MPPTWGSQPGLTRFPRSSASSDLQAESHFWWVKDEMPRDILGESLRKRLGSTFFLENL